MKHFKAIAIKFIASLIVLYIILGLIFNMSFTNVFFISLVLAVVSYLVGDIGILPRTNNTVATLADFGLALMVIWFLSSALTYNGNTYLFFISFISALGIAVFEFFFHKYLSSDSFRNEPDNILPNDTFSNFQTEVSEEITPEIEKNTENNK